jgi:hypothetical protein
VLEVSEFQAAARTVGLEVAGLEIRRTADIAPAFETLKGGADALYVISDPVMVSNRVRINTLALGVPLLSCELLTLSVCFRLAWLSKPTGGCASCFAMLTTPPFHSQTGGHSSEIFRRILLLR